MLALEEKEVRFNVGEILERNLRKFWKRLLCVWILPNLISKVMKFSVTQELHSTAWSRMANAWLAGQSSLRMHYLN